MIKSKRKEIIDIAKDALEILDEKKAMNAIIMDLREVNSFLEYFLIVTANSIVHCKSLYKDLKLVFNNAGYNEKNRPDFDSNWLVMDFGEIIVHIFTEETKNFYQLDKLWADARFITRDDLESMETL